MRNLTVAVVVVVSYFSAFAQTHSSDQPSRETVIAYLEASGVQSVFLQDRKLSASSYKQFAFDKLRKQIGDPSTAQLRKLYDFIDAAVAEAYSEEAATNAVIPVYQKYFTDAEMKQLIHFFKSPVGQKFIQSKNLESDLSLDVREAIQVDNQRRSQDLSRKVDAQIEAILAEEFDRKHRDGKQ